jgi:hypothetical protein
MGRRVILPGDAERRRGLPTIFVPRGHEREPTMVCTVPVNAEGDTCGHPFFPGEESAYERHVGKCFAEHRDAAHAASVRTRVPIMDEESWDPEWAAHQREVGRRMLAEGRLVPHPHER